MKRILHETIIKSIANLNYDFTDVFNYTLGTLYTNYEITIISKFFIPTGYFFFSQQDTLIFPYTHRVVCIYGQYCITHTLSLGRVEMGT